MELNTIFKSNEKENNMKKLYYLIILLTLAFYSCDDPADLDDNKKITDKSFDIEFIELLNLIQDFNTSLIK